MAKERISKIYGENPREEDRQKIEEGEWGAICSIYGDIVTEDEAEGQCRLPGTQELNAELFSPDRPLLKTTGANRVGCMFCGFGCHLEKSPNRFERMKETHPKLYEYIMKPWDDGGLGYKDVIDWINEHGNLHIGY